MAPDYIVVAGGTRRAGTGAGIATLMKAIHVDDHSVTLPDGLDILSKPAFGRRGMHFNGWAFNYPYSFRGWKEEDWKGYIDILSYQNVNLFYLWPFMEIMPVPLSKEDQAYLDECNRVVEYAQKNHGMEVWIMQCTNRVANSRLGVADPRVRPYWRPEQKDLNPGDPKDYQAIMDSREALYKGIPSADGVCNIDSDPGEWPGSPISDYVKVLSGCRAMLDKYNVHGKDTKIISWMWTGWGTDQKHWFDRHQQQLAIQALKKGLPEPWELVAGQNSFLPICREENVLEKTILLQYGLIEGEPAYPMTDIRMNGMRDAFGRYIVKYPQIAGVMGNLQTPLLRFPEMFFFTTNIWDPGYRTHKNEEVLRDVAALLYPEHAKAIADGFLALQNTDLTQTQAAIDELEPLVAQNKLCARRLRPQTFPRPPHRRQGDSPATAIPGRTVQFVPDSGQARRERILRSGLKRTSTRISRGTARTAGIFSGDGTNRFSATSSTHRTAPPPPASPGPSAVLPPSSAASTKSPNR